MSDPLSDWFAYLDRVSRPVRRRGGPEPEPAAPAWRPWMEEEDAPEVEQGVSADQIPDLSLSLGLPAPAETFHPASREFEDPTLHDELPPIPEYDSPSLSVPSFEIRVPRLNGQEEPGSPEEEQPAPEPAPENGAAPGPAEPEGQLALLLGPQEVGAKGGATPPSGVTSWRGRGAGPLPGALSAGLPRESLEAREELVRRLTNPTLTLEEAALILGVCPATVRRYTNRGVLRHFRTEGNQRRFRLSDVLEFLEARQAPGAVADPGA